jgi:double-stranded RNA-binding protein Staufen
MCLINELARFNKTGHQYRLTDENGPAHKKTFTVCLKLGEAEEYIASGPSIKKAQHAAAAMALEKTQLRHPPHKNLAIKTGERCKMPLPLLRIFDDSAWIRT